jgi:hypothetical protein
MRHQKGTSTNQKGHNMKLSEFTTSELEIPAHLVTVREFSKVLGVPDQMIHAYTTKGTIALNTDYGQKRVDVSDPKTLTWLVKYITTHPEIVDDVKEFLVKSGAVEDDREEAPSEA